MMVVVWYRCGLGIICHHCSLHPPPLQQMPNNSSTSRDSTIESSGYFGSSYKAVLVNGSSVVVKRFRHMNNVGKEEFQEHMRRLGRLKHPNLLPFVAYYYREEEKLLVTDFIDNGSLAIHLHGNHARDQPRLDWATRLKIIKGIAKGLAYLYTELPTLIAPHSHLKSSNVLLSKSFTPLLTDYGLVPLINQEIAQALMVAYKSPEYKQHGRITKKTDEEWEDEVFDKEMGGTTNSKWEMVKLLKIGLACCEGM
ncbi:Pollen receptor-like kinase 2 [Vitis vinifera]|uniref:Pollen receptor-like kinase 2 n=1 Tax=Vitis vinifera TaxID=29760 RepID=A0A438HWG2_VITVI|nr:Pollen receptor-like kinase 2 [Vitis vinifera]